MKTLTQENKMMMLSTATLDLYSLTDNVEDFKTTLHEDVVVKAELVVTLPNGKEVRVDVGFIHDMVWSEEEVH